MPEKFETKSSVHTLSMEKAWELLQSTKLNNGGVEKYLEIEITTKITPDHIKLLLTLPYEIALTEKDDKIILTTAMSPNSAGYMGAESEYKQRRDKSKLSFHTHQIVENEPTPNAPSFQDVWLTGFTDSATPLLLAHKDGIMLYRKPIINPETGKAPKEDPKYTALEYGYVRGIDIYNNGFKEKRSLQELSHEEQAKLARQFAENSGMIVKEALWDQDSDKKILAELMDYLNL